MMCFNRKCKRPGNQEDRTYLPYPQWTRLPKHIVDHCECGQHHRVWTTQQALDVFKAAGVDPRRMIRVVQNHP